MKAEKLPSRSLVLLGIGHTNAHVLRMWQMKPYPDTELVCISNFAMATYSGMLPAVLAGQIPPEGMQVDLVRLCAAANARLILDPVVGLDQERRLILFEERPPVHFDALSIGIGSVPSTDEIADPDDLLLRIKPMQTFLPRLNERLAVLRTADAPTITIVGGGVAGVEVACCLRNYLNQQGLTECALKLVTRGPSILPSLRAATQRRVQAALKQLRIDVHSNVFVSELSGGSLRGQSDSSSQPTPFELVTDLAIVATKAKAPELLKQLGLPRCEAGFLATDQTLQVHGSERIFAVGDTGSITSSGFQWVPKAGVYAVRQGPILWQNLRRCLDQKPLKKFVPQRDFLRLINLGDGSGVGQLRRFAFQGNWVYRLKDWIDSTFMEKHEPLVMEASPGEEMQCHGCGCKLGADNLQDALQSFLQSDAEKAPIELEDVAEVGDVDSALVATTDFFTLPTKDAYLAGRLTALHSASDILASGAHPMQALSNVVLQEGDTAAQQRYLQEFLAGAAKEFECQDCRIVGGHTIIGPRAEGGFTVIGKVHERDGYRLRKSGLRQGDKLYLTKPIGIGVLLAAHMRARCPAEAYLSLLELMLDSGQEVIALALRLGVRAATDITGFGLAGHLLEMLETSHCRAELSLKDVPLANGALQLAGQGIESSLLPDNLRSARRIEHTLDQFERPEFRLLFDPQTCGGFLLGIPQKVEQGWLEGLKTLHLKSSPACIGIVTDSATPEHKLLTIKA